MTKEKIYSEVYAVLHMLGNKYIEKVPHGLMEIIENRRDITYNPIYVSSVSIEEQGISRDSLSMIALIHLNYWCDSELEKSELKKVLSINKIDLEKVEKAKEKNKKIEEEALREEIIRYELDKEIEDKIKAKRKERSALSKIKKKILKS